jgi:hypothetical protein
MVQVVILVFLVEETVDLVELVVQEILHQCHLPKVLMVVMVLVM